MAFEGSLSALSGLAKRSADIRHSVMLTGSMLPYSWTFDDKVWANRRKLEVSVGQRVELEFMNHTIMAHPMHLHGHHFQVVSVHIIDFLRFVAKPLNQRSGQPSS